MDFTWAYMVVPFVSAGGGAYLGSYLKKKGENLATREDLDDLVKQMSVVTQATKTIEAQISDQVWNKQRQWEMKREAVFSVVQILLEANDAVASLTRALNLEKEDGHPEIFAGMIGERARKCSALIEAVSAKRVLALVVCGRELDNALNEMEELLRVAVGKVADNNGDAYEELIPKMRKQFARVLLFARREIGVEWKGIAPQSSVSSATPSPGSQDLE